jgi:hypothetical protein
MSPLPEVIPSDLYSFELTSDWEKDAYKQLLAAPTSTPPDNPPPLRKKRLAQQQQQQQGSQAATSDTAAAASAAAAALSAFGYDESALSCFDWEDEEGPSEVQATLQQQQQQQQQQQPPPPQQQSTADGSSVQPGAGSAADDAAYDPAAAWEAWAAYYRSLGYEYDHTNPYLQPIPASAAAAAAGDDTAGQQQQALAPAAAAAAAAVEATARSSDATAVEGVEPQLPQHQVLYEVEDEFEGGDGSDSGDEDGWELPDEDEIDDKARLLLSRLHVTQQAAALAAAAPGSAALDNNAAAAAARAAAPAAAARAAAGGGEAAAGAVARQALYLPCDAASLAGPTLGLGYTQQPRQQPLADSTVSTGSGAFMHQHASEGPLCWECWSAGYTAWQQQYAAWQQQFNAWRQQYQSQQQQQWQQYSSWCDAYMQQQQHNMAGQTGLSENG